MKLKRKPEPEREIDILQQEIRAMKAIAMKNCPQMEEVMMPQERKSLIVRNAVMN
jgi:hypothetical protein